MLMLVQLKNCNKHFESYQPRHHKNMFIPIWDSFGTFQKNRKICIFYLLRPAAAPRNRGFPTAIPNGGATFCAPKPLKTTWGSTFKIMHVGQYL